MCEESRTIHLLLANCAFFPDKYEKTAQNKDPAPEYAEFLSATLR